MSHTVIITLNLSSIEDINKLNNFSSNEAKDDVSLKHIQWQFEAAFANLINTNTDLLETEIDTNPFDLSCRIIITHKIQPQHGIKIESSKSIEGARLENMYNNQQKQSEICTLIKEKYSLQPILDIQVNIKEIATSMSLQLIDSISVQLRSNPPPNTTSAPKQPSIELFDIQNDQENDIDDNKSEICDDTDQPGQDDVIPKEFPRMESLINDIKMPSIMEAQKTNTTDKELSQLYQTAIPTGKGRITTAVAAGTDIIN